MRKLFFAVLLLFHLTVFSQQGHLGSWNVINTKVTLNNRWSVFNELQLRSQSYYNNHYYYEVKGGIGYSLNKNFSLLLGTGKYITHSNGGNFKRPLSSNETRFWQQVTMNQFLQRVKFEHRYRIEQRWFSNNTYKNRFRYRLMAALPINKPKMEPKTFYFTAFDEIFLTNKTPYFERNRVFAGAGYQFNKQLTLQPGYVYQFDYKNGNGTGKHFFQLTLMIELNAHRNPNEKIPGTED